MERSRVARGIVHVRYTIILRQGEKKKKNKMCSPR